MTQLQARLDILTHERVREIRRGIEKESLRAAADGALALTPHPQALGSALTHPNITTDYSEAQVELITSVHATPESCLEELTQIHQFTYQSLGEELLWVSSMPCNLPADENIPIGRYGSSNVGRAKSVYRMGLAHRYGRRMQTISGIHYNWSMPGVTSEEYFALIRNFRRHAFLLLYLFGASPALCKSFVAGRDHSLQELAGGTMYMQYGTSLLQIENEFYGTIRPKRVIRPGERPLHALRERGVEYVEVRLLDLNPFVPVGITLQTMRLLDIFLLHCLLSDSPPDTPAEIAALGRNQHRTAAFGREPGLKLERDGLEVLLTEWAAELLAQCAPIAARLDAVNGASDYTDALRAAVSLVDQPDLLPSARVLAVMEAEHANSYTAFARAQSHQTKAKLLAMPFPVALKAKFDKLSADSVKEQKAIEEADSMLFEAYRQQYISPDRLGLTRAAIAPALAAV